MEIFNQNKVSVPSLPTDGASVKERLAHEIASCIIGMMNRNDPAQMGQVWLSVVHHGNKEKQFEITVAEGFSHDHTRQYKSGSKVFESVLAELSKVSKIDRVSIQTSPLLFVGVFSPDSPVEAAKSDSRKERVKKLKDAMKQLREEHFLFSNVRYTAEVRSTTGKRIGELLNVFGKDC